MRLLWEGEMIGFLHGAFWSGIVVSVLFSIIYDTNPMRIVPVALWTLFCGMGIIILK